MKMVSNGVMIRRMEEVGLIAAGEDIFLKVKGHGVHGHGGEQEKLRDQHEELLPALATHLVWYKVVVRMVQQYQGILLHTGCSGSLLKSSCCSLSPCVM